MSRTPNPPAPRDSRRSKLPEDLIARFRALALRHYEAPTPAKANYIYDKIAALRRAIYGSGDTESRRLLALLDDPHPAVRLWAAFDALSLDPEAGVRVLSELAAGPPGRIRFDADLTLERYYSGDMDLRPWDKNQT